MCAIQLVKRIAIWNWSQLHLKSAQKVDCWNCCREDLGLSVSPGVRVLGTGPLLSQSRLSGTSKRWNLGKVVRSLGQPSCVAVNVVTAQP